tara:strand:- start:118 stop:378 length:261 start_codon:yes stop_codon:yes gene_type:complete
MKTYVDQIARDSKKEDLTEASISSGVKEVKVIIANDGNLKNRMDDAQFEIYQVVDAAITKMKNPPQGFSDGNKLRHSILKQIFNIK